MSFYCSIDHFLTFWRLLPINSCNNVLFVRHRRKSRQFLTRTLVGALPLFRCCKENMKPLNGSWQLWEIRWVRGSSGTPVVWLCALPLDIKSRSPTLLLLWGCAKPNALMVAGSHYVSVGQLEEVENWAFVALHDDLSKPILKVSFLRGYQV